MLTSAGAWHLELGADLDDLDAVTLWVEGEVPVAMYGTNWGTWKVSGVYPLAAGTLMRMTVERIVGASVETAEYAWFPYLVEQPMLLGAP